MSNRNSLPKWLLWSAISGIGLVMLITLAGALTLAHGAADPPQATHRAWDDTTLPWLAAIDGWQTAPQDAAIPAGDFTLSAWVYTAPEQPLAAWGLWLETSDGARVVYALNSAGYTTTRRCPQPLPAMLEDCPALQPGWRWMPYPRINPPGETNRLTLHLEPSGNVRLRINREILGAAPVTFTGRWGVWQRSANALTWERVTLWIGD